MGLNDFGELYKDLLGLEMIVDIEFLKWFS